MWGCGRYLAMVTARYCHLVTVSSHHRLLTDCLVTGGGLRWPEAGSGQPSLPSWPGPAAPAEPPRQTSATIRGVQRAGRGGAGGSFPEWGGNFLSAGEETDKGRQSGPARSMPHFVLTMQWLVFGIAAG